MQAVIPRPDVAPLLQAGWVALAADADEPEPQVHRLLFRLPSATMLPIVLLADAEGSFLGGKAGGMEPKRLVELLGEAEARTPDGS